MKQQFITNSGQPRLLLIFAGWGMDSEPFRHMHREGYDIAVIWDYRDDQFDNSIYADYKEVAVIAWSMGVWGASRVIPSSGLPVTLTIAINGTMSPVHDSFGIPVDIFNKTLNELDNTSLLKFYRRIAGGASAYREFAKTLPQRPIDELHDELSRIMQCGPSTSAMRWDRAIVSSNDAIFPPVNQHNHWDNKCETIDIQGPHLPNWTSIIDRFLIDKTLVESRFRRSMSTYDNEAQVQQRIATHLWEIWQKHMRQAIKPDSIIEVGYGTGAFTRLYTQKLQPSSLQLWDLITDESISLPGTAISCDAEIAIMEQPEESADAIVSASTIQWFNSIRNFLQQSHRVLRPGGLLVVSTFGNKTFHELTQAGGASLPYIDIESMHTMIPDGFELLELHDGIITRMFDNPLEVLRHIKATGVNAVRRDTDTSLARLIIANYPTGPGGRAPLTYNPLYLVLKKL